MTFRSEPPRDEFGNITREWVTEDGLLKSGPSDPNKVGRPVNAWRRIAKSDPQWVSAEVIDEARKERTKRQPKAGYYRIRDVQAQSKRVVAEFTKGQTELKNIPDVRLLTDAELVEWHKYLAQADKFDWLAHARPDQLEPDYDYHTFLYLAGRGAGKTRAAAEVVRKWCNDEPGITVAVVALGHRELRDVCLDGPSGLLNVIPHDEILSVKKGLGDISVKLTNGSEIVGFTSGNPEALRGRSFAACWLDEYAAWNKNLAQDTLDQLWFCLRESPRPRVWITTTPRRVPHVVDLVKRAEKDAKIVVRYGRTRDNTALSEAAVAQLESIYADTRLGMQELEGKLLLDVEGALWTESLLEPAKLPHTFELPRLLGTCTGYDYAGGGEDPAGVVTIGWDANKVIYVLENKTTNGSPAERYSAACLSAYEWKCRKIYYEGNQGDASKFGLEQQWKTLVEQGRIPATATRPQILPSNIKGSKADRAYPVVALYEKHAVNLDTGGVPVIYHLGPTQSNGIAKLESEQCDWDPLAVPPKSPNAIDALTHAVRQTMREIGLEIGIAKPNKKRRIEGGWRP